MGKVININDPELLQFFYPEYKIKENVNYLDIENKIIYNGRFRNNLDEYLIERTKSYISTVGKADIDLTKVEEIVKFVYESRGRNVPEKVKNILDMLDEDDIIYCCKIFWITGKWVYLVEDDELSMFDLFKSMVDSVNKMVEVYFQLLDKYPFYVIESSFLTFLQRVGDVEEQQISGYYRKILNKFKERSGNKIKKALMIYIRKSQLKEELRFLDFLLNLR